MQLIYYPNPILFQPCDPVLECRRMDIPIEEVEKRTELAMTMWKIMDENNGVGLAAPQVGLNIRMFVWKPIQENKKNGIVKAIWNPTLTITLKNKTFGKEGCLSFPGISVTTRRPIQSTLTGIDSNGKQFIVYGGSVATRIWCHEIDHLDGKLIIDNMNRDDTLSNRDALKTLLNKHRD